MPEDPPSWESIHKSWRELTSLAVDALLERQVPTLDKILADLLKSHMDSGFCMLDQDEERLLFVVMSYRLGLIAEDVISSPDCGDIPSRQGMDSANVIGTVLTRRAKRSKGRKIGAEREAGAKWLTGLRKRQRESEASGQQRGLAGTLLTLLPTSAGRPKRRTGSN